MSTGATWKLGVRWSDVTAGMLVTLPDGPSVLIVSAPIYCPPVSVRCEGKCVEEPGFWSVDVMLDGVQCNACRDIDEIVVTDVHVRSAS